MLGAIIATQLTDQSARSKRLNIGGGPDVLARYAGWATSYSVDMKTITLLEEGPGGVSSLSFSVWDPLIQCVFEVGSQVEFWDITRDRPLFLGFLQSVTLRSPGGVGRYIDIECIGVEVLLDWMLVPSLTVPAGTYFAAAIQSVIANATGVGFGLRAFSHPIGSEDANNEQQYPIAGYSSGGFPQMQYAVTFDGSSLRQAIADVVTACDTWVSGTGALTSVDFYGGVRVYPTYLDVPTGIITGYLPVDYDTMYVEMEMPRTNPSPGLLSFTLDPAGVVRAVYIVGANAAGSGLVSDGTGIPGQVAYVSDSTSNTATIRNAIAASYLSQFSQSARGSLAFNPMTSAQLTLNLRAGGAVHFETDAQIFGEAVSFNIMSIRKTFRPSEQEDWSVSTGGFVGSANKQLRRLTRDTRS